MSFTARACVTVVRIDTNSNVVHIDTNSNVVRIDINSNVVHSRKGAEMHRSICVCTWNT